MALFQHILFSSPAAPISVKPTGTGCTAQSLDVIRRTKNHWMMICGEEGQQVFQQEKHNIHNPLIFEHVHSIIHYLVHEYLTKNSSNMLPQPYYSLYVEHYLLLKMKILLKQSSYISAEEVKQLK
jgi:hypothetical protein